MQPQKEQTIRQKLGSILGLGASRAAPLAQKSYEELGRQEHGTFFTADVLRVRNDLLTINVILHLNTNTMGILGILVGQEVHT